MMSNMAKIPFSIVGPENILGLIPIFVHLVSGKDKGIYEPHATILCIIISFIYFYGYHMTGLITQYYKRNPHKNFWIITDESRKEDQKLN